MWTLIIKKDGIEHMDISSHPYQGEAIGIRERAITLDRRIQMLPPRRQPKNFHPIAWTAIVKDKTER